MVGKERFLTISSLFLLQSWTVYGMHHLVYWDKKMIPALSKDGLEITLEVDDWMDVLCPYYANFDASHRTLGRSEYLYLYNVTENEFLNCDTRRGTRVQDCDDPFTEKKLTTKFQERSPSPFGFTFRAGATYYYISKTIHEGLSVGCTETTLKMIVHVKQKGTVFPFTDQEDPTQVYHEIERAQTESTRPSTTTAPTGHFKHSRHHPPHHHNRERTTSSSKPDIVKGKALPHKSDSNAKASTNVQDDDPENTGHSSMSTSSVLTILVSLVVYAFSRNLCTR